MILSLLSCDRNGGMSNNKSPWPKINYDIEGFVSKTKLQIIITCYDTFTSIGSPVMNQFNIVVCQKKQKRLLPYNENTLFITYNDLDLILSKNSDINKNIVIIGGSEIITYCMPFIHAVYIVQILDQYVCDDYIDVQLMHDTFNCIDYSSKIYKQNSCYHYFEIRSKNTNLVKFK